MSESTPLINPSSGGGGAASSYYFLQGGNKQDGETSFDASIRDGPTGETVEQLPEGTTGDEFASRPVMTPAQRTESFFTQSAQQQKKEGFFSKIFRGRGAENASNAFEASGPFAPIGSMVKQRKVPIKVEPKVFFANERTFLAWLHISVLLAGASIAIISFADANPWSQLYGVILLPVAIAFICYAMYQYSRRAAMIRRRDPGPYEDTTGPTVLGILLMMSIIAQFALKLYTVL